MDTAEMLAALSTPALADHAAKALQVYEAIMTVYAMSEQRYQAALQVPPPINGFAASTNGHTQ